MTGYRGTAVQPSWEKMNNNTEVTYLPLSDIKVDPACQARAAGLDTTTVDDYAEAMKGKGYERFKSVVVFYDGANYWLSDGFHRYAAAEKAGLPSLKASVRRGSRREAILNSVGVNVEHGLRRTREDKRRAVSVLLADEEWSTWSNREIARRCRVDEWLVRKLREELEAVSVSAGKPQTARKVKRNDTVYEMKTDKIGKKDDIPEVSPLQAVLDDEPEQVWDHARQPAETDQSAVEQSDDSSSGQAGIDEAQLDDLMSAWSRSSERVRGQFLARVGISLPPQVEAGSGLVEAEQEPEPLQEPAASEEPAHPAETSCEPEPQATELSAGVLVEMWECYSGHTKTYGRDWVEAGCPDEPLPSEHFIFTEKLVPFRAAVRAATGEEREQFLELTRGA